MQLDSKVNEELYEDTFKDNIKQRILRSTSLIRNFAAPLSMGFLIICLISAAKVS